MYCIKCGRNLPDTAKFCDKCGNPITKINQENPISDKLIQDLNDQSVKDNFVNLNSAELEDYPEKDNRMLLWRLFSTKGIVKRKEYVLTILTCEILATLIGATVWGRTGTSFIIDNGFTLGMALTVILLWSLVWIKIAVTIKRLKSCGWNNAAKFLWVMCFFIITDLMLLCVLSFKKSKYK